MKQRTAEIRIMGLFIKSRKGERLSPPPPKRKHSYLVCTETSSVPYIMISNTIPTSCHDAHTNVLHVMEPTSGRPMSWTSDPPTVPGMFGNATPERRGSNMSSFIDSLMDDAKWRSYIISKLEKNKPYSPKMSDRVGVSPTFSDVDFVEEAHALAKPGEDPTPEEVWNADRTRATTYPNAYPYDFTYPVTSPNAGWKWATEGYVPDGWDIGCRAWTPIDPPPIHTIIPSDAIEPTAEIPLFGLDQPSAFVDHHFEFDHAAKPLASVRCSPANHITVSPHIHITPEKAESTKNDRESPKKARKSRSPRHHKKKRPHLVPVVEIETKPRIGDPILVVPLLPTHEEKISTNSKPIVTSSTSSTPAPPIDINDANTNPCTYKTTNNNRPFLI